MHAYPPILAALLNPALLYSGAAAVSLPILIHLLARRRFKRIRWAAMEFLLEAQRRNRRRLRMEEWILLALRCAAVLALGAMLARPFVEPTGLASSLRRSQRTERILLLDDSFSMAYESPEGTPLLRAKEAVRRVLDTLRRDAPDDTVTMFRMTKPDEPMDASVFLTGPQIDALRAKLEALAPSQRSIDSGRVLKAAAAHLENSPDVTNAAVYIVSDFQRKDWTVLGSTLPTEIGSSLLAPLTTWAKKDRGLRVILLDVGDEDRSNTAVTELALESGQVVAGAGGKLRLSVTHVGSRSRGDVELQTAIGNVPQASKTLRGIGPAQTVRLDLDADFPRPGYETVRAEVPPDALPLDDVRYLAVEAVTALRILIVNGEPAADIYSDEAAFLATALRPEGEVFSGNEVTVVEEGEFGAASLSSFHLVILANVYRINDTAVETLERYLLDGGGVLVFLGDQIDVDAYNSGLFRDGAGLLPGALTEIRRPSEPVHLSIVDRLHPALRGLAGEGDPLGLAQIPFFEFVGCKPFGESTEPSAPQNVDVARPSEPMAGFGLATVRAARILAQFDDADRTPAIVERPFGAGRVILVGTTADKEWHLWPDHPTFLPVITELAHHAARRNASGDGSLVGKAIEFPLDPADYESEAAVRSPAYPNEPEAVIRAIATEDGEALKFSWPHTESAGFYQMILRRRDGAEVTRVIAVNVDSDESDLTAASEDDLRRAMTGVRVEYVKGLRGLSDATTESRVEIWRWLLTLAALTLVSEQGLAWFWGRRR